MKQKIMFQQGYNIQVYAHNTLYVRLFRVIITITLGRTEIILIL